jgi:hypothetical protein
VLHGVKNPHAQCGGYAGHPKEGSITLARGQVLDGMTKDSPPTNKKKQQVLHSVAWVGNYRADNPKSRVFATTHGASEDILDDDFRRMLVNAHFWCLGMEDAIKADGPIDFVGPYHPTTYNFGGHRKGVKPADIKGWNTPIHGKTAKPSEKIKKQKRARSHRPERYRSSPHLGVGHAGRIGRDVQHGVALRANGAADSP